MGTFWQTVASNAVLATLLAVGVALAARFIRRPQVVFWLWMLVLLKLVTPPILPVPLESDGLAHFAGHQKAASLGDPSTSPEAAAGPGSTAPGSPPIGPPPLGLPHAETPNLTTDNAATTGPSTEPRLARAEQAPGTIPWGAVFLAVWVTGSMLWFALAADRLIRFRRLVRHAKAAPCSVQTAARQLAGQFGLRRLPRICVARGRIPPLLWWACRGTLIVLPEELLGQLDPGKQKSLIAHELAHLRRGDHLVRWAEVVILGLYWWHPVAWWARRQMQQAGEQCCDAWVLWASDEGPKSYANTLLTTAEFLSIARPLLPAAASGLQRVRPLKRRMEMILKGPVYRRMSWAGLLAVALIALSVLPWSARAMPTQDEGQNSPTARSPDSDQPSAAPANPERRGKAAPRAEAADDIVIRGKVLAPDGKPAEGAQVHLLYPTKLEPPPELRAETGKDGRFRLALSKSQFDRSYREDPWAMARLAAICPGYGMDWTEWGDVSKLGEITFRLVPDVPVRGRIFNHQGNPVAGARIRIRYLMELVGRDLDAYVEAVKAGQHDPVRGEKSWWDPVPGGPPVAETDGAGRFQLTGLGADRVAEMVVEGPGIHYTRITVMTREMDSLEPGPEPHRVPPRYKVYAASFRHVAAPARTITGVVRDKQTGKPIAGARVWGGRSTADRPLTGDLGRFEIPGCAKSEHYDIHVSVPNQPYFSLGKQVDDTPGLGPITVDFELAPGILVEGRVTDRETGKPVQGIVEYRALYPNEHIERVPTRLGLPCSGADLQPDGSYRIAVLPGPGVIAVQARHYYDRYAPALVTPDDLKRAFPDVSFPPGNDEDFLQIAHPGGVISSISQTNYNALELINPAEDSAAMKRDFALTAGRKIEGKVTDADGKPLVGATVIGLTSHVFHVDRLESDAFTVKTVDPRRGRHLHFYHKPRNLGLAMDLKGDETGPLTVRLQPCGSASGRLVGANNEPVTGAVIVFNRGRTAGASEIWGKTDADGKFQVAGLIPGEQYTASTSRDHLRMFRDVVVEPGEKKDLGTKKIESRSGY